MAPQSYLFADIKKVPGVMLYGGKVAQEAGWRLEEAPDELFRQALLKMEDFASTPGRCMDQSGTIRKVIEITGEQKKDYINLIVSSPAIILKKVVEGKHFNGTQGATRFLPIKQHKRLDWLELLAAQTYYRDCENLHMQLCQESQPDSTDLMKYSLVLEPQERGVFAGTELHNFLQKALDRTDVERLESIKNILNLANKQGVVGTHAKRGPISLLDSIRLVYEITPVKKGGANLVLKSFQPIQQKQKVVSPQYNHPR